eukprot:jgi/Ulvmu1/11987/UM082_0066.1
MTIIKQQRKFAAILFDLDDTLYRVEEIPQQVKENIIAYTVKFLGVPADEAEEKALSLYREYGTTMAGLVATGHTIDFDHWHRHVHGTLPYDEYLSPNTKLREALCSIELPRFVFTNADRSHATICLDKLGIADCFQGVVNFETLQHQAAIDSDKLAHPGTVACKPNSSAFLLAMHQLGLRRSSPHDVIFLDDSVRNVTSAHRLGMFSVLVGKSSKPEGAECDLVVPSVMDLHTAAPWLFNNPALATDETAQVGHEAFAHLPGSSAMWRGPRACAAEADDPQHDTPMEDRLATIEGTSSDMAAVPA